MRHFLTIKDYQKEELQELIASALELKQGLLDGQSQNFLAGKTLAMIFQKPSNRTRVSFEVGMYQLGGKTVVIREEEIGMGKRETIADVSRVLSRYVDGIMLRPFYHSDIEEFAEFATVPVINGLSDLYHPCQALADMLTIWEFKKQFEGIKLCYIGDGNNVCNSLILICEKLGIDLVVACPSGYEPTLSQKVPSYVISNDPKSAVLGADVVYTDVWVSMGPANMISRGVSDFVGFTVSQELMSHANKDAIFMHCLPAHRGEEVTDQVLESSSSVVFDQAENRLHAQKAILKFLLK